MADCPGRSPQLPEPRGVIPAPAPRCRGNVHEKSLVACVRLLGPQGTVTRRLRTVGMMTDDLRALAAWLQEAGVTHAAIESPGILWKPVWNVLESTP